MRPLRGRGGAFGGDDSYQGTTLYQGSNSHEIYVLTSKRSNIGSQRNTNVIFSDPVGGRTKTLHLSNATLKQVQGDENDAIFPLHLSLSKVPLGI